MKILDYLINQIKVAKPMVDVRPELRLFEDIGITSLSLIRLITESCKKFGIDMYSLSSQDLVQAKTVDNLATLLHSKGGSIV
jgi:acyl carrier protein